MKELTPYTCENQNIPAEALNGCLVEDADSLELKAAMIEAAISISTLGLGTDKQNLDTDARTIKFDDDLRNAFNDMGKRNEALWMPKAGKPVCCAWEWVIARIDNIPLPLCISQGNVGSCSGHAAHNAAMATLINKRAFGFDVVWEEMHRIATWYASKGDSMRGGQVLSYMADYMCRMGMIPAKYLGNNVLTAPTRYKEFLQQAKQFQSYTAYVPITSIDQMVEDIFLACKAGYAVSVGNTRWPSSSKERGQGLPRKPVFGGGGGHATMVSAWRPKTVNAQGAVFEEAISFNNSHGATLTATSEEYTEGSEPTHSCWLTKSDAKEYLRTAKPFGEPVVYMPESTLTNDYYKLPTEEEMYRYVCPVKELRAV